MADLPRSFPCWCKAVYSWGGETKRDLGFIEGDLIECLNAGDGSWWMGRLKRDRRAVGLFPSNFVELLAEDYQPWSRNASPLTQGGGSPSLSRQNSAQPAKQQTPQKAKTFRKPFGAYAAAAAPNPAAAAREIQRAGGRSPNPNGSLKTHKPYSAMKRSSTESRETASPAPGRRPSNLRAVSPRPSTRPASTRPTYARAVSPAPPTNYGSYSRAVSPAPPPAHDSYSRTPSPAPPPPAQYRPHSRAVSPAPPAQQYQHHSRAVSPAPPAHYQYPSRAVSPAPPAPYRPHSRAISPAPPAEYRPPSRAVSPAPSFQYRAYDRGPSPSPYQDAQFAAESSPPPPPPPHRVAYQSSRAPSPAPPQNGPHTPGPRTPDLRSGKRSFTPSPLTNAMGDVMSALQDMSVSKSADSPDEPATPPGVWSPEAFNEVYHASAKKVRAQTSMGIGSQAGYPNDDIDDPYRPDDDDGPPQVHNYVQRMESRLRRMKEQEQGKNDELFIPADASGRPPSVPPKNSTYNRPVSSMEDVSRDVERKGSKTLRHRKSAYEIGRNVLGRTFTTKTTSTTTTHTSNSTNRSLMSGQSATNMSSTSAGSYYRKKFAKERSKSVMEARDPGKGYTFDDERPETPFTGVTYHSSHASRSRPGSSHQPQPEWYGNQQIQQDGPDPLGGLMAPKAKRSGFFRKMIDTAKTQAANTRSAIASGSISRPGSRAASRAVSRAASRIGDREPTGLAGGTTVQSSAARDMGLNGSIDWVQVRRDVNRSNSLSKNEMIERADRCQMMDIPVINPVDILYDSAEGDEGLDGLPIAEPTDFSACNLGLVDKSARFVNSIPLGTTPGTLAQGYICRPYRSDVQRLRAIFTWVSERISWEEDFEGDIDTRHVLQSKRGCSQEIATVVADMCTAVGLHAEVVRGYLKTPGEPLDLDVVARPNHFWNAVIVEGEWRMMDCSLAGPTNPKRAQYSNTGSQVAEGWYFLARPMEICFSHVPLLPEQQHICPPQPHDVLMALPCATPTYFKHRLHMVEFDTSLLNLDNLEMSHIHINVPEDVECVAEVEARAYSQDADGDFFESGDVVRRPALAQAEWVAGQKRYTVKALLPGDEGHGVLKVYAGPRGLMHSNKVNPHALALGLPITHTGANPPYSFLTLHPTPHAQRHDLYVAQPQCANIALNNTFVFTVRQHPSSLTRVHDPPQTPLTGRASPNPFARPTSAMSMQSISASGSNYTNPSQASSGSNSSSAMKPAKLAVQTPSGKIIRLTRKNEHLSGTTSESDGSVWETVIKIGEKGTWRGLVLADRSARWCVFAQWECA